MSVIKIKAPKEYINEPNLLRRSGSLIREYGKSALIVASAQSVKAAEQTLFPSMEEAGIGTTVSLFSGYATFKKAEDIARQYGDTGIDVVIGLGGGRVIDTAKIVATLLKAPAITIPTIAATCAAWAAVSIVYDDAGRFQNAFFNTIGPELVLADTRVLMEAPRRFLHAGIIDSLAKWYEIYPYQRIEENSTFLNTMTRVCAQLKEILEKDGEAAFFSDDAAIRVINAVIYLAGLSGSLQTDTLYQGIAHPLYNVLTKYPESRSLLHGEIVGFGLLLQQELERHSLEEIEEVLRLFGRFQNTLTLADLGLEGKEDRIREIAEDLYNGYRSSLNHLGYGYSADEIYRAILKIDSIVGQHKINARQVECERPGYPDKIIKLDRNENTVGFSPKVIEALDESAKAANAYPDVFATPLREKLALFYHIRPEEILVGNGSFELINLISQVFINPGDEVIYPDPSFEFYKVFAKLPGGKVILVPLENHRIPLGKIARAITHKTKIIWICNPNNPTGTVLSGEEIVDFLNVVPPSVLVAIDEAYIDFVREAAIPDLIPELKGHPNLILLRTFSKVYGLAALRVGYAIAGESLIDRLIPWKVPPNTNYPGTAAAIASLADRDFYGYIVNHTKSESQKYYAAFEELGLPYIPSNTNFIFFHLKREAAPVVEELARRKILVRGGAEYGYPEWIRVSIGTAEENLAMIGHLKDILRKGSREE